MTVGIYQKENLEEASTSEMSVSERKKDKRVGVESENQYRSNAIYINIKYNYKKLSTTDLYHPPPMTLSHASY